jgi:hypothetical protein
MSAPDTTSKGRPSLISETAPGAPDTSSRILASLEGRVVAQQAPRQRRSRKPWFAVGLALAGLAAAGASQWQRVSDGERTNIVAAGGNDKAHTAGSTAAPAGNASGAVVAVGAASAPQAAVIVADDAPASSPNGAATDPLSRALANGAAPSTDKHASAVNVAEAPTLAAKPVAGKAARTEHEGAKNRHAEKPVATRASKHSKGAFAHDDPDADLLAALVARTKPYDARAPRQAASGAKARAASVAAQVKECDKSNFFEAQLCRWRACSDHWGKDPACPSANAAASSQVH